ncbi:MAG TPA: ferritin-like domain-containing protein [Acidobacteriaceae bacterium]|nr:ferritin-like domain-containing protein [Acidobacteriaceae bacterium]
MDNPKTVLKSALSRRTFLAGAGTAAAAGLIAGCSDNSGAFTPTTSGVSDVDVLNFALNLEYLEAEFYLRAATGLGLTTADIGSNPGTVVGGAKVPSLSAAQQNVVNEIAYDEQQHVRALRATITAAGGTPVSRPNLDLTNSFAAVATVANTLTVSGAAPIPSGFSPFADFNSFLVGAFVFEDVGVTAYNGAAPLISTAGIAAGYLAAAAGILAVEAYHAAYVRTTLTANAYLMGTTAYPYLGFANRISAVRALLGGSNETALAGPGTAATTTPNATPSTVVASDTNALAYHRNTDQVLHIVYGTFSNTAGSTTPAAGVAKGGFFPNGLNGNITVTQS